MFGQPYNEQPIFESFHPGQSWTPSSANVQYTGYLNFWGSNNGFYYNSDYANVNSTSTITVTKAGKYELYFETGCVFGGNLAVSDYFVFILYHNSTVLNIVNAQTNSGGGFTAAQNTFSYSQVSDNSGNLTGAITFSASFNCTGRLFSKNVIQVNANDTIRLFYNNIYGQSGTAQKIYNTRVALRPITG